MLKAKRAAMICLWISSAFKLLAKHFSPTIFVDSLSLPGWAVIHTNIVHIYRTDRKIAELCHDYYPMPDEYQEQLKRIVKK